MKISIVTTLYKSSPYIREFYTRMVATIQKMGCDYEIIFVNDGSPDNVLDLAIDIQQKDTHVRVIDLTRNFGHHKAMLTGLAHARGSHVYLIDVDLEEAPENLVAFEAEMKRTGADVVYGVQEKRNGPVFKLATGSIYYWMYRKLTNLDIPKNLLTSRFTTREYNDHLTLHLDQEPDITGLWSLTGYNQVPLKIERSHKGATTYTLSRMFELFVRSMTGFSKKPLYLIFWIGCIILMLAVLLAAVALVVRMVRGAVPGTDTAVLVSVWLLGGLILLSLGIIAIYMTTLVSETKRRPYTLIKKIHGHPPTQNPDLKSGQ